MRILLLAAAVFASDPFELPAEPPAQEAALTPPLVPLTKEMRREVEDMFPGLRGTPWGILEWKDNGMYNCFAHSVGIDSEEITESDIHPTRTPTLKEWDAFYRSMGFGRPSKRMRPEADVALFSTGELPEHASRRSVYTLGGRIMHESKVGRSFLLLHTLEGLEGGQYGRVIRTYQALKRPLQ